MSVKKMRKTCSLTLAGWACLLFASNHAKAAPPATQDSNPPTTRPITAAQQIIIVTERHLSADQPAQRIDVVVWKKDGTPNPNCGQPDPYFMSLHESFLARIKQGPIGLLFLGDSITLGWTRASGLLWQRYVDKYHAADFGVGGDRTDHVLWRIANGELDGIHPKIVVLLIGTNNIGRHTADQVIAGETKIVQQIHEKLPETKVLIIGIFPRSEDPAKKGVKHAHEKIKAIDAALARLDDGNKTRYLYFGDKYIDANGEVDKTLLPDFLHPNAKGYQIWADAMEPLLDQMLQ